MATITFHAIGTKSPHKIYVRFSNGRDCRFKKPTQLLIDPNNWDSKKGKVKDRKVFPGDTQLRNHLAGLRKHILTSFNDDYSDGLDITGQWLRDTIDTYFNRPKKKGSTELLLTQVDVYIDYLPTKEVDPNDSSVKIDPKTIQKYRTLKNHIEELEDHYKRQFKVSDVNLDFRKKVIHLFHDIQGKNLNTVGKTITNIKTVCKYADENGIKVHHELRHRDFRPTKEEVLITTLELDELEMILNHDFGNRDGLDNARNWLIIGCWTAPRVSDLLNLTMENVRDIDTSNLSIENLMKGNILYSETKGNKSLDIVVPILEPVAKVLNRIGGFPRKISEQKLNKHIKTICKEVGISEIIKGSRINPETNRKEKGNYPKYELITAHGFRRTWATNCWQLGLPISDLMTVTGHATPEMFLKYINRRPRHSADRIREAWNKEHNKPSGKVLPLSQAN